MNNIIVKTYANPRRIKEFLIQHGLYENCIHVCPSQEMIQGFNSIGLYKEENIDYEPLITVKNLINSFYPEWTDTKVKENNTGVSLSRLLRQIGLVGQEIAAIREKLPDTKLKLTLTDNESLTVDKKFLDAEDYNAFDIVSSLRLFCELGISFDDSINYSRMSEEQKFVVYIYNKVKDNELFKFERLKDKLKNDSSAVDDALRDVLDNTIRRKHQHDNDVDTLVENSQKELVSEEAEKKIILFDGIFQFPPALLAAIDDLRAAGYQIYMIHNFRREPELQSFYQCWRNIYKLFSDKPEFDFSHEELTVQKEQCFIPNNKNEEEIRAKKQEFNKKNLKLALAIGKASEGIKFNTFGITYEFKKYANVIDFANDIDREFRQALKRNKNNYNKTLSYMEEMPYSTSRRANDILRAYHPKQFGYTRLIDYPVGRMLYAASNKWNNEKNCLDIKGDFGPIEDCIRGYSESVEKNNSLITNFNILQPYIENAEDIKEAVSILADMIDFDRKKIEAVFDIKRTIDEREAALDELKNHDANNLTINNFSQLSVNKLSIPEIKKVMLTLIMINRYAEILIRPYDNFGINKRLKAAINRILKAWENGDESQEPRIRNILGVFRDQLDKDDTNDNMNDTNSQLKEMIKQYLKKVADEEQDSARWIVHDMVQIDGDILVRPSVENRVNHFCFLSDKELCRVSDELLPRPLTVQFFEGLEENGIKYEDRLRLQKFTRSKKEQCNFSKYALVYGILFSECAVKLSYVENIDGELMKPYHVFELLGMTAESHRKEEFTKEEEDRWNKNNSWGLEPYNANNIDALSPDQTDIVIEPCSFRYVFDRLLNDDTYYYNRFNIVQYISAVIIGETIKNKNNDIDTALNNSFADLDQLTFLSDSEKNRIINDAYDQIKKIYKKQEDYHSKNDIQNSLLVYPVDSYVISSKARNLKWEDSQVYPLNDKDNVLYTINKDNKDTNNESDFCNFCPHKSLCPQGLRYKKEDDNS